MIITIKGYFLSVSISHRKKKGNRQIFLEVNAEFTYRLELY